MVEANELGRLRDLLAWYQVDSGEREIWVLDARGERIVHLALP